MSRKKIEAAAITTSDEKKIRDIYYALSNTIILGVASGQSSDIKYFVSLTLPDGEECRFDFVNETTIRLSSQNYVAETDGSLWSALVMPEEEISKSDPYKRLGIIFWFFICLIAIIILFSNGLSGKGEIVEFTGGENHEKRI